MHTKRLALTSVKLDQRVGLYMVCRLCLAVCLCVALASCGQEERERSAVNVARLSTDVHVSIGEHALVLPLIALEDYAYRHHSFSLNRKGDSEHAQDALSALLRDSADPDHPLALDGLTVVVRTYGWNDADMRQKQVCSLVTREWARSVCDNPWAAIQQALPANRFMLVDMRRLQIGDPRGPAQCIDDGKQRQPLPQRPGEARIVCEAKVYGGDKDKFYNAVVRIDGDLGALWMVWRYGQSGETAEAMTEREGKAIIAFVKYGLGPREHFQALHRTLCRLRRPESVDAPQGPDCKKSALSVSTPNPNEVAFGSSH